MCAKGSTEIYSLLTYFQEGNGTCRKCFHRTVQKQSKWSHPQQACFNFSLLRMCTCSTQELTGGLHITPRRLNCLGRWHCTCRTAEHCCWICMQHLRQCQAGEVPRVTGQQKNQGIRGGNWVAEQWKWIKIKGNAQSNGVNCTRALRRARRQKEACEGDLGLWIIKGKAATVGHGVGWSNGSVEDKGHWEERQRQ